MLELISILISILEKIEILITILELIAILIAILELIAIIIAFFIAINCNCNKLRPASAWYKKTCRGQLL